MTCEVVRMGGHMAILCGRNRRGKPKKCWVAHCKMDATRLCDRPVGDGKTCDHPVCDGDAYRIGENTDYCPACWLEEEKRKAEMAEA